MAKCTRESHPKLFGYLEAYGMDDYVIQHVDRIKENGHYAVVGWVEKDGSIGMLDVSKSPDRTKLGGVDLSTFGYNMCNDGMDSVSESDWNKIRLDRYCDTFTIPGNDNYE